VTDRQTDRRTDGRTDGRTDRITTPKTALSIARAVKMERQPHKVAVGLCAALKLTENNYIVEVERAHAPVPCRW